MEKSNSERMNSWVRRSVTLRILAIAFLIILLLIPLSLIQGLIRDREFRLDEATSEVSDKWSGAQEIAGPYITLPYKVLLEDDKGETQQQTRFLHVLPDSLIIDGIADPEIRYRGIYDVTVYRSALAIRGQFSPPDVSRLGVPASAIMWDDAVLSFGLTDLRGITERVVLNWDGTSLPFGPGLISQDVTESGVNTRIPIEANWQQATNFSFDLDLKGSRRVSFVPVGTETLVHLSADWPSPSFDGSFLPDPMSVTDAGFEASWRVLQLNRDFPRQWTGGVYPLNRHAFGVTLLLPVDEYRKSRRAADYAVLIISLVFLVFFFMEIRQQKRIHPLQYLLVGLSLALFYVLVLALSEHWFFGGAYLASAAATIALITGYVGATFKSSKLTGILAGLLVVLFGFVYVLLQLEDYALLVGSVGLFLILAFVMLWSRNIDWYQLPDVASDDR